MAGIYLHIPFCKNKCHYCNFFSLATTRYRPEFLEALRFELTQRQAEAKEKISTIYFGGGTPSLLSRNELDLIFEEIYRYYQVDEQAEITLEANPDDLSAEYLRSLKGSPINRLSIGIQSFNDGDLKAVNRAHNAQEAYESVVLAREFGFSQISIDLIYGIPSSTTKIWEHNLRMTEKLMPGHLSAYSLTQELNTAYDVLVKKGKLKAPDDDKAIEQYELLQQFLPQINMEQYEISNYARDGKYALHNTSYWNGIPYLGFGPSAHSFNGTHRRWNKAHLKDYLEAPSKGKVLFEEEKLSLVNHWNEWIMTGLRTKWGIDLSSPPHIFPEIWKESFKKIATDFIRQDWMSQQNHQYFLSYKGKFFADGIAAEFFIEEE